MPQIQNDGKGEAVSAKAGSDVIKTQQSAQDRMALPKQVTERHLASGSRLFRWRVRADGSSGGSVPAALTQRAKMIDKLSGLSSYSSLISGKTARRVVGDFVMDSGEHWVLLCKWAEGDQYDTMVWYDERVAVACISPPSVCASIGNNVICRSVLWILSTLVSSKHPTRMDLGVSVLVYSWFWFHPCRGGWFLADCPSLFHIPIASTCGQCF